MELEKKLARGIAGWLQFEHACHRASVFSEKYLCTPIAQILNTIYGANVHAEIKHPILGNKFLGKGRRPEIDFVVYNENNEIIVAIESKWIGDSTTKQTVERIIWDLLRLAMIGNNDDVSCYFILAGRKKHLDELFENRHFNGEKDKKGRVRPILKVRSSDHMDSRLDSTREDRIKLLKPILQFCQDIELPMRLGTGKTEYYPKDAFRYDYQAWVWEVMPNKQNCI